MDSQGILGPALEGKKAIDTKDIVRPSDKARKQMVHWGRAGSTFHGRV